MAAVSVKAGVAFDGDSLGLCRMLTVLLTFGRTHPDAPRTLLITAGSDGEHSINSKHYKYEAFDLRSHNFASLAAKERFRADYERALGPRFRVLLESIGRPNEHFHCQVRKGMTYP